MLSTNPFFYEAESFVQCDHRAIIFENFTIEFFDFGLKERLIKKSKLQAEPTPLPCNFLITVKGPI